MQGNSHLQQQPKKYLPPDETILKQLINNHQERILYNTGSPILPRFFDNLFGKNPHIFSAQQNDLNKTKNKEATTKYLDLCKL